MRLVEPFIDAHQHFWDLGANPYPWLQDKEPIEFRYGDYSALRRNYLPADLARDSSGFTPAKTVHVEAEWDRCHCVDETLWLTKLAGESGLPSACVAHAALDSGDAGEALSAQAAFAMVRGIRHKPLAAATKDEARRGLPGSMDDERWRLGYALLASHGLSFDLQAPWWNLDQAADLARDFPGIQMIINHTGLPSDRSVEGLAGWRSAMEGVARFPNVALKISGLGQRKVAWTQEGNIPVIRDAIAIFGAGRCMFASNFPVDSLVATYESILSAFAASIADRPDDERRMLLHDNAQRIYRL